MEISIKGPHCLNCSRSEKEVPLVVLLYLGKHVNICPGCLPILIHHPERLADKLKATESIPRVENERD